MPAFDIIGDIHGCSLTLVRLLTELGYDQDADGVYRHTDRTAVFLGDFIDRGPYQREVISIVRSMIDAEAALSVMGNHEFNAIAYATRDEVTGTHLRPHSDKNIKQHMAFLAAYADDEPAYQSVIKWFRTLPLWLDLGGFKVVHACWDKEAISKILEFQDGSTHLSDRLLHASCKKQNWQYKAVETILKGKEISMPEGHSFHDKDGNARSEIRIRWWDQFARNYREAFLGPKNVLTHIPEDEISGDHLVDYSHDEPPVFLGHYWMEDNPGPLAANIACVDYSVGKRGGKLVAYRWDGEQVLHSDKYVSVDRQEEGGSAETE